MTNPIAKPSISGTLINLRPLVKADAQAMFEASSDELMRLTGTKKTFTFKETEDFCAKLFDANDRVDYAITLKDDPAYIGEVVLNSINFDERMANFRIGIGNRKHFNKGYGSESTFLILKHGFETLKLHRISLEVFDFNPRALHVYEKIGFRKEGILRDVLLWDGKYHNSILMSMLEDEWFSKYNPTDNKA